MFVGFGHCDDSRSQDIGRHTESRRSIRVVREHRTAKCGAQSGGKISLFGEFGVGPKEHAEGMRKRGHGTFVSKSRKMAKFPTQRTRSRAGAVVGGWNRERPVIKEGHGVVHSTRLRRSNRRWLLLDLRDGGRGIVDHIVDDNIDIGRFGPQRPRAHGHGAQHAFYEFDSFGAIGAHGHFAFGAIDGVGVDRPRVASPRPRVARPDGGDRPRRRP